MCEMQDPVNVETGQFDTSVGLVVHFVVVVIGSPPLEQRLKRLNVDAGEGRFSIEFKPLHDLVDDFGR